MDRVQSSNRDDLLNNHLGGNAAPTNSNNSDEASRIERSQIRAHALNRHNFLSNHPDLASHELVFELASITRPGTLDGAAMQSIVEAVLT